MHAARAPLALCALLLCLSGRGIAQPISSPETGSSAAYRIGPKDLLAIQVAEVPELDVERRVSEEGTISLPSLGEVGVAGLTADPAAARLKSLLEAKYINRATVEVAVREFRSKPISLIGAVAQPGPLAFSGRWTLLDAITAAGGLAAGHGPKIYVLRRADNGLSDQIAINADDLMLRADPRANIPIFANDLINVPPDSEVTIYCLGEVKTPGALTFRTSERLTLLTAIARAGGLSDRASSKIVIKRHDPGAAEITVNYKRIVAGTDPDVELHAGDLIVVKESFL